jgi:hypothetical protein
MFFSFLDNPYIAIIGDIKCSRKLEDRNAVQEELKGILNRINEKYGRDISSKFIITLGDEFQGLLCNGKKVISIIEEIDREMYPVKIRFGIGVGTITTDIISEMAIGSDGPAYYKARQAVSYLKKNEQKYKTHTSDVRLEMDCDNQQVVSLINTTFSLMAVVKHNWSTRQREIINDTITYHDGQKKTAERLNVAQSTIQRGLLNGNYYAYKEAWDTVEKIFKEIGGINV